MVRCDNCGADNEDGAAYCAICAQPLTGYAGQLTGEQSAHIAERRAEVTVRPVAVNVMAGALALLALVGPLWRLIVHFAARQTVNAESTNYMGAMFGTVGLIMAAVFLIPTTIVIALAAWGVFSQRSWGYTGAIVVVGGASLFALLHWWPDAGFARLVVLAASGYLSWSWSRPEVRHWFGLRG